MTWRRVAVKKVNFPFINKWECMIHIEGPMGGRYIWPFEAFTRIGLRMKTWRFMCVEQHKSNNPN